MLVVQARRAVCCREEMAAPRRVWLLHDCAVQVSRRPRRTVGKLHLQRAAAKRVRSCCPAERLAVEPYYCGPGIGRRFVFI